MLSLPIQGMYSYLAEVSMANPLLDIINECVPEYENVPLAADEVSGLPEQDFEDLPWNRSWSSADHSDDAERPDPMNLKGTVFELDTLTGSLELQLSMCGLNPVEKAIGREIIGNLDDCGYFTGNLASICLFYEAPLALGEKVLSVIREFSPRGIAAYDVYDALCLQVEDTFPYADTTRKIICADLDCLRDGRSDLCAHKYGLPEYCINEIFDYIRRLEPKPGNCDAQPYTINYITPDIIVKYRDGDLCLFICGNEDNPLQINDEYLRMMHLPHLTPEEKAYFRARLNEARSLIRNVDVRCRTIQKFALELVKFQSDFFRLGPENIRPLTMQRMAEAMEVNVSTISRIVQEKYISTPWGTFRSSICSAAP
jgi:RNA polymerase sigma-54 factor